MGGSKPRRRWHHRCITLQIQVMGRMGNQGMSQTNCWEGDNTGVLCAGSTSPLLSQAEIALLGFIAQCNHPVRSGVLPLGDGLECLEQEVPSSPAGICPSLTSGILCVLQGQSHIQSSELQHPRWSMGGFLHSHTASPGDSWGICMNPGNQREPWRPRQQTHCSFSLENIFKVSLLPTCPGLGSAQVSCCSSVHQLFHVVIQIPCVALSRPPRPCAAKRCQEFVSLNIPE